MILPLTKSFFRIINKNHPDPYYLQTAMIRIYCVYFSSNHIYICGVRNNNRDLNDFIMCTYTDKRVNYYL